MWRSKFPAILWRRGIDSAGVVNKRIFVKSSADWLKTLNLTGYLFVSTVVNISGQPRISLQFNC